MIECLKFIIMTYILTVSVSFALVILSYPVLYLRSCYSFYRSYKNYISLEGPKPDNVEAIYKRLVYYHLYMDSVTHYGIPPFLTIIVWPYAFYNLYFSKGLFSKRIQNFLKKRSIKSSGKTLALTHPDKDVRELGENI